MAFWWIYMMSFIWICDQFRPLIWILGLWTLLYKAAREPTARNEVSWNQNGTLLAWLLTLQYFDLMYRLSIDYVFKKVQTKRLRVKILYFDFGKWQVDILASAQFNFLFIWKWCKKIFITIFDDFNYFNLNKWLW